MPWLIPRGISLFLFLSFDLEQCFFILENAHFWSFNSTWFPAVSFHFILQGTIKQCPGKTLPQSSMRKFEQISWRCVARPHASCNSILGKTSLQRLLLDRIWFIGLTRACSKPFSDRKHQFNLYIVLNREIPGLFCSGSMQAFRSQQQIVLNRSCVFLSRRRDQVKFYWNSQQPLAAFTCFFCLFCRGGKRLSGTRTDKNKLVLGLIPYASYVE